MLNSHQEKWGSVKSDLGSTTMRSRSERIYPTKHQRKILMNWMHDSRLMYNSAVNQLINTQEKADKYKLRNNLVIAKNTTMTDPRILKAMNRTPKDIRAKAVFEACTAHNLRASSTGSKTKSVINPKYTALEKTISNEKKKLKSLEKKRLSEDKEILEKSIKNLEEELKYTPKRNPKYSKLNYRKKKDQFYHIFIPKSSVKIKEKELIIFPRFGLGSIRVKRFIRNLDHDFIIRVHRNLGSWNIIIPDEIEVKPQVTGSRTIALDPGIRTFLTGVDSRGQVIELGKNWSLSNKIRTRLVKLDASKTKKISDLNRRKIHNIIDDLHKKSTRYLLDNYDIIILPKLRTKSLLRREGFPVKKDPDRKFNRKIMLLAHCKFHDYIVWKAKTEGKVVVDQNESYTTQTCFRCGLLNNIGSSKSYECHRCKNTCDRDIQSSLNIMTRYMSSYSSNHP